MKVYWLLVANQLDAQKKTCHQQVFESRENKIWTCDPYVPNVVLYQAELLPGNYFITGTKKAEDGIRTRDPHHGKVMFYHWTTSAFFINIFVSSRENRIRTCDPLVPNQVLYQAELFPVICTQ